MKFKGYTHASMRTLGSRLAFLKREGYITPEQFDRACINRVKKGLINNTNIEVIKSFDCIADARNFLEQLEKEYKFVFMVHKTGAIFCHPDGVEQTYTFEVRNSRL